MKLLFGKRVPSIPLQAADKRIFCFVILVELVWTAIFLVMFFANIFFNHFVIISVIGEETVN